MGAASFTKIASTPDMLRYYVSSTDGTVGAKAATSLISDCAEGALKRLLTQLNAAGSWGATTATPASNNPMLNTKLMTTLTPYTVNAISAGAACQYANDGSNNALSVTGGHRFDGTVIADYTSAILELRYVHSTGR
jgi:hypothetical protein